MNPKLPAAALEIFDYWLAAPEPDPVITYWWLWRGQTPRFAALQLVETERWLVTGDLAHAPRTGGFHLRISTLTVRPWKRNAEVTGEVLRKIRVAEIRDSVLEG